ncbi:hypothetical protein CEUSTIGMA_g13648.t1 [Chlamydomonas eustigma]|uniref:Uncharacterized protein n=1 Tax=Chlamydomonas eustigma TaxID=1157962 RepID=A0A250XT48_9CHLO|nr:hypothetical protein CEUSTIGMA_g13648.t1 [Chlamydomonas eustigma]|eukprot:GAX86235.1 hypothetical protein CEUSTIGMA_g13648.t1 [Chlamydomonas eustigma]
MIQYFTLESVSARVQLKVDLVPFHVDLNRLKGYGLGRPTIDNPVTSIVSGVAVYKEDSTESVADDRDICGKVDPRWVQALASDLEGPHHCVKAVYDDYMLCIECRDSESYATAMEAVLSYSMPHIIHPFYFEIQRRIECPTSLIDTPGFNFCLLLFVKRMMYQSPNKRARSNGEPDFAWRPNDYPDQIDGILDYYGLTSLQQVASATLTCMHSLREVYFFGKRFKSPHCSGSKALFHQAVEQYRQTAHLVRIPDRGDAECVSQKFFGAAQAFHDDVMETDFTELTNEQLCQYLHTGTITNQRTPKPSLMDQWNRMLFHYIEDAAKFSLIQRNIEQTARIHAMESRLHAAERVADLTTLLDDANIREA